MAKKYWTFKGQKIPVKKYNLKVKKVTPQSTFNKVVRLTGRVNRRINEINNTYGKRSWATNKLLNRLDVKGIDVVRGGKIKIPKNLSEQKLKLVESALNNFLKMKTSNVRGIEDVIKRQKKNIKTSLSDMDKELTNKEVETLYNFFEDKDFNRITDMLPASDAWAILEDAKTKGYDEKQFINSIKNYIDVGNDMDMILSLSNIYNKYVSV